MHAHHQDLILSNSWAGWCSGAPSVSLGKWSSRNPGRCDRVVIDVHSGNRCLWHQSQVYSAPHQPKFHGPGSLRLSGHPHAAGAASEVWSSGAWWWWPEPWFHLCDDHVWKFRGRGGVTASTAQLQSAPKHPLALMPAVHCSSGGRAWMNRFTDMCCATSSAGSWSGYSQQQGILNRSSTWARGSFPY